ncbi:hypothetical protein MPSI1_003805 [Malassezia psittaci]|uniref:Uncharacterized protein n=1 Tax=Malassezia psittaci TaxID=1821823 RepID=A0AAF0FIK7_9BASI|nr:hypothetical protein MPSI1_003805 [Malassezia psittaci]
MDQVASNEPIFASYILATAADITEFLASTKLHTSYLPIAFLSVLHAVRISHATRMLSGGLRSRVHLFQSVVLDLIVLFGGATMVALLLGEPLPILISPVTILVYASVHVLLYITGIGTALLKLHSKLGIAYVNESNLSMDILLAAIDAICRSEAIASLASIKLRQHPDPSVSHSLFAQMMIGALISGGVPLLVGIFNLDSPAGLWSFGTPAWLQRPSLLLSPLPDLIGGVIVSMLILLLTSSSKEQSAAAAFMHTYSVRQLVIHVLNSISRPRPSLLHEKLAPLHHLPYLSLREAKAISAIALFVILTVPALVRRVYRVAPALKSSLKSDATPIKAASSSSKSRSKSTKSKTKAGKETLALPEPLPVSEASAIASQPSPAPRKRGRPKKIVVDE